MRRQPVVDSSIPIRAVDAVVIAWIVFSDTCTSSGPVAARPGDTIVALRIVSSDTCTSVGWAGRAGSATRPQER